MFRQEIQILLSGFQSFSVGLLSGGHATLNNMPLGFCLTVTYTYVV